MKFINLYIFSLVFLVKSIVSFSCENVYLDSKENLYKATSKKIIEKKIFQTLGEEIYTWYIDPCRSVENEPEKEKKHCPDNSKVCLVKSVKFNDEKEVKILDIKGYAVNNPKQEPEFKNGDYILNFEGEKDSGFSAEFKFTCAGNRADPEVTTDDSNKKVFISYKGMCVDDNKALPVDDDKDDSEKKKGSGHFLLRFILIIIICYFIIGMCYNYFVLNKNGIDIIPNVDLWIAIFGSIYDKISELFGRRDYRPILQ